MLAELNLNDRRDLRKRVIDYFKEPRLVEGIAAAPGLESYGRVAVHRMVNALHLAGELEKVGGTSRDSSYKAVKPS